MKNRLEELRRARGIRQEELAEALDGGLAIGDITYIRGTAYRAKDDSRVYEEKIVTPSFEEVKKDKRKYAEAFRMQYLEQDYRQGRVVVDGRLASSPEEKVDADAACLLVDGQSLDCRRYTYLMLHKPAGVLSARVDGRPIPFSFKASRNSSSSTKRPAVSMARKSVASV